MALVSGLMLWKTSGTQSCTTKTPENSVLGFCGAKMLSMLPYVMKQLKNTN